MKYVEVLSKLAPVFSALIALIAAIFISKQIANIRRNREVDTLMKLITLADSDRMSDARDWLIYELHNYSTAQELKANKEAMKKFSHIVHLFNTMGVLVNNGYIPETLVFNKYGLLVAGAWNRLQTLISSMRAEAPWLDLRFSTTTWPRAILRGRSQPPCLRYSGWSMAVTKATCLRSTTTVFFWALHPRARSI